MLYPRHLFFTTKSWQPAKYVLGGSSSIWTGRILNICFDFFQLRSTENNNKYSKFDMSKSMRYQGHELLHIAVNFDARKFTKFMAKLWACMNISYWSNSYYILRSTLMQVTKLMAKIVACVKISDTHKLSHVAVNFDASKFTKSMAKI